MAIFMVRVWVPFDKTEEVMKVMTKMPKMPSYIKKWQILSAADGTEGAIYQT